MDMRKALLFRLGGLGDLLVALPSIQFLRRRFPASRLSLVCREEYGGLLRELKIVNEVLRGDGPGIALLFSASCPRDGEAAVWIKKFDLIVAWKQGARADDLENNLLSLAGPERCRFFRYGSGRPEPASRFFYEQTAGITSPDIPLPAALSLDACARLPVGESQEAKGLRLTVALKPAKQFVVVHPGSGGKAKLWPLGRFLEIVRRLGRHGVAGVIVTGEAEAGIIKALQEQIWPERWTWLRSPSLDALSGLLKLSSLYLGNDSGITHLAAACGAEAVALFLEKNVTAWRPLGRVHLLSAASLDSINVETVWRVIESKLGFQ